VWGVRRTRITYALAAIAVAALAVAALMPGNLVPRTGLGYMFDHFSAYCTMAVVLCVISRRPYVVAGSLAVLAATLEALQGLTPDRSPDFTAPLAAITGAVCGVVLAELALLARRSLLAALERRRSRYRRGFAYSTGQSLLPGVFHGGRSI
jgi:hypothetical protein